MKNKKVEIDRENGWKICNKCCEQKLLDQFLFNNYKQSYETKCKMCSNLWFKEHYHNGGNKLTRQLNYQKNKSRHQDYDKKYNKIHKDKRRKYRKDNKEKIRLKNKKLHENRMINDLNYRILTILRWRIRHLLKDKPKQSKSISLLGCSIDFFIKHLESKFQAGMTWHNRGYGKGKWVIDHVIPCEIFDLSQESHQMACFNYKNLQPLWCEKNSNKSDWLNNNRRARDLTKKEKEEYLKANGILLYFISKP